MRNPVFLRWIDSHFGPSLLRLISLVRGKKPLPPKFDPQEVCILKIAAIGDTVLASALIEDLRKWKPSIRITLMVGLSNRDYAKLLAGLAHVEVLDFRKPFQLLRAIRRQSYDLFIDADSWPRVSALVTSLTRSALTVGFETSGQKRHYAFDLVVAHSKELHELENYRNLLRILQLPAKSLPQAPGTWNPCDDNPAIVFHLWASGRKSHLKHWNFGAWTQLGISLLEDFGGTILLTGAPADRGRNEAFLASMPASLRSRFQNHAGIGFADTLALLEGCRLLVSVNTGIMHVGATMGVPTVGLHGPQDALRWGPIGPRTRSVLSRSPGAGHLHLGFEYVDRVNRMEGLSVEDALRACRELVEEAPLAREAA